MKPSSTFTLDELCTLSDCPKRTVRYYMQIGLVDRPIGGTKAAHYLPQHLDQLLKIRRLSDAGVSLERIREVLSGEAPPVPPRQRSSRPMTTRNGRAVCRRTVAASYSCRTAIRTPATTRTCSCARWLTARPPRA